MSSKKASMVDGNGKPISKWQIRIRSEEPTLVEYKEIQYDAKVPEAELFTLIWRTSYQVGMPNREVWWAVDLWIEGKQTWQVLIEGKSRVKKDAKPI